MTQEINISELQELKKDIFDYLTDLHNNQIKGFYDWDGYWKKMNELKPTEKQLKYLPQLYEYMCQITITDIVAAARAEGKDWLSKYGNYGRGRRSDSQKYAISQATATINSPFIKKNFQILTRVKLFVGFYLGIFHESEVLALIEETKMHELNSTFYSHRKAQISNAIFRLEILYSYLSASPFASACLNELKELAKMQLDYLSNEEKIEFDNTGYNNEVEPLRLKVKELKNKVTDVEELRKEFQDSINQLSKEIREIGNKYHIGEFSQIINYI